MSQKSAKWGKWRKYQCQLSEGAFLGWNKLQLDQERRDGRWVGAFLQPAPQCRSFAEKHFRKFWIKMCWKRELHCIQTTSDSHHLHCIKQNTSKVLFTIWQKTIPFHTFIGSNYWTSGSLWRHLSYCEIMYHPWSICPKYHPSRKRWNVETSLAKEFPKSDCERSISSGKMSNKEKQWHKIYSSLKRNVELQFSRNIQMFHHFAVF